MKITPDNLKKLHRGKKIDIFYGETGCAYFYKEQCLECKEPFFGSKNSKFCTNQCAIKSKNETKNK